MGVYFGQAQLAEQGADRSAAVERWRLAWYEAQAMVRRDASARSYLADYQELEEVGRRLGQLT